MTRGVATAVVVAALSALPGTLSSPFAHAAHASRLSRPLIIPTTPGQHHAVPANSRRAYVAARIVAPTPIVQVRLLIDGRSVRYELMGRDERHQSVFTQPPHLSAGTHHIYLIARDTQGTEGQRHWLLHIAVGTPTLRGRP